MTVFKTCVSLAASLITGTPLDVSRTGVVDSGQKALIVDNNNSPALRPSSISSLHNNKANAKFSCYTSSSDSPPIPNGSLACASIPNGSPACVSIPNGSIACASIPNGSPACASIPNGRPACASIPNGSPACASIPNGSPACASIPNGSPACASIPNGSPACASIPNGSPVCASIPNGGPACKSVPNGHVKGYANGHANGLNNGHANGLNNGLNNGHANGFANGHIPSTSPYTNYAKPPQPYERWVRPLGYAERCMTRAHDYGCMTTVYSLWLDSRVPLDFGLIHHATEIMYRKMPNLRMKLNVRNGELWWKESSRTTLDVEELVSDNVEASVESLLHRQYNMEEGPLWFARFVTLKESKNDERDNTKDFNHKYVCIFGFHHNASDGTSNMKFCKVFLKVLNDLVQGKDIDMKEEGTFAVPLQDALGDQIHTLWFFMSVFFRRLYAAILTFGISVRNFTSLFKMPAFNKAETHILQHELDEITTKKLISRCKMEGVTLNSAFTAAANLSMYEMMLSRDESLGETNMWSQQAINMRRYWPLALQQNSLGCHISLLDISFSTNRKDLQSFWEYAREINRKLKCMLTEVQRPLRLQPMSERLIILIRHNSWLAWLGLPSANDNHYTVTNMGNLHTTFPGVGEVIEASKVLRSVSCHFMPTLCQHTLQTFRGRFCYSLDYYTQKLSKETATTYAQGIMDMLRKSIHSPN